MRIHVVDDGGTFAGVGAETVEEPRRVTPGRRASGTRDCSLRQAATRQRQAVRESAAPVVTKLWQRIVTREALQRRAMNSTGSSPRMRYVMGRRRVE
jgi:hypothetical protein